MLFLLRDILGILNLFMQPIHISHGLIKKNVPEAATSFFISLYISDLTSTKLLPRKILNFHANFCSAL